MKAISVRQPWAFLIADGQKTVEARSWRTDYRGDVLLCTSAKQDSSFDKLDRESFPLGMAYCVVEIKDCVQMKFEHIPMAYPTDDPKSFSQQDIEGQFAWLLENPRIVTPFFPVKGKLNFYDVVMPKGVQIITVAEYLSDKN